MENVHNERRFPAFIVPRYLSFHAWLREGRSIWTFECCIASLPLYSLPLVAIIRYPGNSGITSTNITSPSS